MVVLLPMAIDQTSDPTQPLRRVSEAEYEADSEQHQHPDDQHPYSDQQHYDEQQYNQQYEEQPQYEEQHIEEHTQRSTSPFISASAPPSSQTLASIMPKSSPYPPSSTSATQSSIGGLPSASPTLSPFSSTASTIHDTQLHTPSENKQRYLTLLDGLTTQLQHTSSANVGNGAEYSANQRVALSIMDALRGRYAAFAASPYYHHPDLSLAFMQFLSETLSTAGGQQLLSCCIQQLIEHMTVALSAIGYYSYSAPACSIRLSASVNQARLLACRAALSAVSAQYPMIYLSPFYAADIPQMCFELSLSQHAFHVIPTQPASSESSLEVMQAIDVQELHRLIMRHKKERKQTCIATSSTRQHRRLSTCQQCLPL